jgi:hypothetical protein
MRVTVVYCPPGQVWSRDVELAKGATLGDAIGASGLLQAFDGLEAMRLDVGVFSRPRALDDPARDGDRIEVYRALTIDPKEARRVRAEVRRRRGVQVKGQKANRG